MAFLMTNNAIHGPGSRVNVDCASANSEWEQNKSKKFFLFLKSCKVFSVCIVTQTNKPFESFLHHCWVERQI